MEKKATIGCRIIVIFCYFQGHESRLTEFGLTTRLNNGEARNYASV